MNRKTELHLKNKDKNTVLKIRKVKAKNDYNSTTQKTEKSQK